MIYRTLADIVVVVHFAFVLFAMFGGLLVLRWVRCAWLHLPAAVWAAGIEFGGWICPLTWLEDWLWRMGGQTPVPASFVERYLMPLLYPHALTRGVQVAIGLSVVVVNLVIYATVVRRILRSGNGQGASGDR